MAGGPGRLRLAAALIAIAFGAAACGGRFALPPTASGSHGSEPGLGATSGPSGTPTIGAGTTVPSTSLGDALPGGSPSPAPPATTTSPSGISTHDAIIHAYESYLVDLSGLDDTLNKSYVTPLASVTTMRLAQASVRQAAAILSAQEHGVGTLRDDHIAITMTSSGAALADCQDEDHFYLVSDDSGTADPFVARGYFVGSAQLVSQNGHWLVDTFTTTHVSCTF